MRRLLLALPVAAVALGLVGAAPAQAHDNHGTNQGTSSRTTPVQPVSGKAPSVFLAAKLSGANEVPTPGGPAVGDPEGRGIALVRVKGNRVSFSLSWTGIGAPTLGHIHQGGAGVNGPVKVPLFGTAMPETVRAAAGAVTVDDAALATQIRTDPAGFYVNLHSAEFAGGAVRGQLRALRNPIDVLAVVRGGGLRALLDGEQEVPTSGGPAVGDRNGHAVSFIRARGTTVGYSMAWIGIGAPTLGHIHQGGAGVNGPVKVPLFATAVPDTIFAVSGVVPDQPADVVSEIRRNPAGFYVNIHTAEFPGGAVRGQLSR